MSSFVWWWKWEGLVFSLFHWRLWWSWVSRALSAGSGGGVVWASAFHSCPFTGAMLDPGRRALGFLSKVQGSPMGSPLGCEWSCSKHSMQTYHSIFTHWLILAQGPTGPMPLMSSVEEAVYYHQVSCTLAWVAGAFQSSLGAGGGFPFLRIDTYHRFSMRQENHDLSSP